jgi:hypothetical protein
MALRTTTIRRGQEDTRQVRCCDPDEITVAFDDQRLVADAGLTLPATLAVGLGCASCWGAHIDLGEAPGRANVGDKAMTLIHSAMEHILELLVSRFSATFLSAVHNVCGSSASGGAWSLRRSAILALD